MSLTEKQEKKLLTLVKREHKVKPLTISQGFKIIENEAYYTNGFVAVKVKNNVMTKEIGLVDMTDITYPIVQNVFTPDLEKLSTLTVKDLLKELKAYKKENPKPIRKNFNNKYAHEIAVKKWGTFHIADDGSMEQGTEKFHINFALDRLVNSLEMLVALDVKEVNLTQNPYSFVRPFQLESDLVDVAIATIKVA